MRSPIPDYLDEILDKHRPDRSGANADYIPALASADPEKLAIAISTLDGVEYTSGDSEFAFSIQSMSKPFVYGMALERLGLPAVLDTVGVEPTGEAFNELSLDKASGKPLNPMINAGAIAVHALLGPRGASAAERAEIVRAGLSEFAGRDLRIDASVAESERAGAYRNVAIANMLRSYDIVADDPDEAVNGYIDQCSILVTVADLALMAATLAGGGINPRTGHRVLSPRVNRQVLGVMMTCGMYDVAGDWMTEVGVPAKSGVSGGVFGVLPGQVGIAAYSPRLDGHGSSVRGTRIFRTLSDDMGLHIMEAPEPARSIIRRDRRFVDEDGEMVRICSLQGLIQWSGAENVLRTMDAPESSTTVFILDLRRVYSINDVARRLFTEALARMEGDGVRVMLMDPENLLACAGPDSPLPGLERIDSLRHLKGLKRIRNAVAAPIR
ncbi:L-glutaminase [Brevibacterium sanguinis]|uniref:Glutaminase n=2 Tax=Brevibacterium TaxID=1696 RepID=A0A366IPW6_9MICO|nr:MULTISPECIES: glutaminase [Brevibacterium]RBP68021.1 L-glutaminase [Brevibacterium sanguinis]RBP74562.1 L-glutaminase [Brevibacterium celere]